MTPWQLHQHSSQVQGCQAASQPVCVCVWGGGSINVSACGGGVGCVSVGGCVGVGVKQCLCL